MPLPILQPGRTLDPEFTDGERRVLSVAASAVDLRWLSLTLFLPLVDLRGDAAPWGPSLALSAGFGLAATVAAVPLARLSDAVGRRATLLATTVVLAGGCALLLAPGAAAAVWGRVLMGLGAGAVLAAVAWTSDALALERRARAHGIFAVSGAVSVPLGIAAGAALAFAPRWSAPALVLLVAALSLVSLLRTEERPPACPGAQSSRAGSTHGLGAALRAPALGGPLLAGACGYAAVAFTAGLLPGALGTLGAGWLVAALVLGILAAGAGLSASTALTNRGRGALALALGLALIWGAGAVLATRRFDHATGPVLLALPAFMLLLAGGAAVASSSSALLVERGPEMWRAALVGAQPVTAFAGAALGAALAVATARTFSTYVGAVPLAALAIVGAAGALLPGAEVRRGRAPAPEERRA